MITILLVGPPGPFEQPASRFPALEILRARDADEAIEKLARNRRIDAVLLAGVPDPALVLAQIREENPSPPPAFVPASSGAIGGATSLPAREPGALLALLLATLSGPEPGG